MIAQTKTKRETIIMGLSIFVVFTVILSAVSTADGLSGKYFPADSPIFANLYPNKFLPWVVSIFLLVGWLNVKLIRVRLNNSYSSAATIIIALSGLFLIHLLSNKLGDIWFDSDLQKVWAKYLSDLCEIGGWAWFWGNYLAFFVYRYSRTDSAND